jgi:signal transduction histidine kinase
VLGHLGELAREQPDELPRVFLERQGTLDSGVSYLQSLASNYARLAPSLERRPCDPNRIAREVVGDAGASGNGDGSTGARVETDLAAGLPPVYADPVALRRILENLIVNAVESLEGGRGRVLVWTRRVDAGGGPPRVHLGVSDTGRGMTPEARARVFDDFFTTKPHGTGLGLSIVRRLVGDLGGSVHVESAPGEGTRFTIELPSAPSSGPTARADRTPDTAGSSAPHPPDRRP